MAHPYMKMLFILVEIVFFVNTENLDKHGFAEVKL